MNDAERDAWLREALRHAPDSEALPPRDVSETILAKARAAAHGAPSHGASSRAPTTPANPVAAFWAWLARPPVAAGFASVMAATLVGVMWWDRPMDETLPRSQPPASSRAEAPAPSVAPPAPAAPTAAAPAAVEKPAAPPAEARSEKRPGAVADTQARDTSAPERAAARERRADATGAPASKGKVEELAKERAVPAEQRNEAPAPFPSTAPQDAPARQLGADRKDAEASLSDRRGAADVERPTAKSSLGGAGASLASPPASTRSPALFPAPALTAPTNTAPGAVDPRQKESAEFSAAASSPLPFRRELDRSRADAAMRAAPLTGMLASITAEPLRWSRQTPAGDAFALEPGWRAWLGDLDAATAGRWRPLSGSAGAAADTGGDRAMTLRLLTASRVAAVVRLQGTSVQIDTAPGSDAGRWQATLSPAAAERLRDSAQRLGP